MKKILFFILIISPSCLFAQKLQTDVIISTGANQKQATVRLDWTLGETVGDVRKGYDGLMLMQGYQQIPCDNNLQTTVEIQNVSCFGKNDGVISVKSSKLSMKVQIKELQKTLGGTEVLFKDLKAGNYTLSIVDSDSCGIATERQVFIDQALDFKVDAGKDERLKKGESIQLNAFGADTYRWSPATGLSDTTSAKPTAKPTQTTTYIVKGFVKGCFKTDTLTITVIDINDVVQKEPYFSPNGDGVNDTWTILNIDKYPDAQITIYNRWGQEMMRFINYKNDWDGRYNGQLLEGTLYYKIYIPSANKFFAGDINILR